ncbi:MAG: hypothetical protein OEQ12_04350 [Nitrosopumilus sp.]|nr:hypothetical protein [Nitrosopumilus sp.]
MIKKIFFNTKIIIPILVLVFAIYAVNSSLQNEGIVAQEFENQDKSPRAIIIDQLSEEIPNENFKRKAINIFEEAGYEVDIVEGQDITVDFYKDLPSMNYKYIVLRSHAVAKQNSDTPVVIFTGERYSTEQYISEQLFGHVMRAAPLGVREIAAQVPTDNWTVVNETYQYFDQPVRQNIHAENDFFAISPKLVDEMMVGQFPSSTILLGGCSTLSNPSMAKSLIKRGASEVVGWDDLIGSLDNDRALLAIIEENVANNLEIEDAVSSHMEKLNKIPNWNVNLKSFSDEDM